VVTLKSLLLFDSELENIFRSSFFSHLLSVRPLCGLRRNLGLQGYMAMGSVSRKHEKNAVKRTEPNASLAHSCISRRSASVYQDRGVLGDANQDERSKRMSVRDTICDDTNVETEGKGDRQAPGFELPDCCRPMIERMMKAVGNAPENETGAKEGGPGFGTR